MNSFLLKDITDKIGSGATPNGGQNSYYSEGISFIRSQNIYDFSFSRNGLAFIDENQARELNNVTVKENDILLNITGDSIARVCKVPINILPARVNQHVSIIRSNKFVDSDYLLGYLVNMKHYLLKICGVGGTRNALTKVALEKLVINLPDLITQKKIGLLILNINSKIELNNRINAELEAMAKTLYDYWFVQFDFPDPSTNSGQAGKPYKSSGDKMVWNEELKREIPEGWEVGTLSDIAELIRGVSYGKNDIKEHFNPNVIPILRATNLTGNVIDLESMVYVQKDLVNPKQYLNKYDILITMSSGSIDHIGKNGLFYYDKEVAFGAFCAKLVAKNNFRFYLYSYTQSDFMMSTIKNECLGTNINNLNGSLVYGFKIIIPPEDLIDNFNTKVCFFYEKISINQKENQKLTELRDWLLPMLMNGQVKVS